MSWLPIRCKYSTSSIRFDMLVVDEHHVDRVDVRRLVRLDQPQLKACQRCEVRAPDQRELLRLQDEERVELVEPVLMDGERVLELVQLLLRTHHVALHRADLRVDDGDLFREDALLHLRVRDLVVEGRDALVDHPFLAMDVAAGRRSGEHERAEDAQEKTASHLERGSSGGRSTPAVARRNRRL